MQGVKLLAAHYQQKPSHESAGQQGGDAHKEAAIQVSPRRRDMLTEDHHRSRIQSAVESLSTGGPSVPNHITDSWMRCMKQHALDPATVSEPYFIERVELQERQNRLCDVLSAAKGEMANLFQQIAGSGYAIMLTDADGVLLNYFGDPGFTHAASKTGMMPGAVWSEPYQGTNGMGTALLEKRPTMVQQYDHFLFRNTGLTCAAAPIFDAGGEVLAVLDASGETHLAPRHVLDLVNMSVHTIEQKIFLAMYAGRRFMHFHSRPEFVATLSAGILALDEDDTIVAATRTALPQLGVKACELIGHPLEEFFNVSFESLSRETCKLGKPVASIFDSRFGRRFFAFATATRRSVAQACTRPDPGPGPGPDPDLPSERATPLERLQFGPDPVMTRNAHAATRVLERDVAILLCGETGTGKEMFAKAIHQSSQRARQPFVAINCASIPESLIESELFGYKSGAFTGASKEGQRGKIFQADGGTLFLDEIGDMPIQLQARLLRVLEEREVVPLGSETPVQIDIRLVSATHCDLLDKIEKREFREDLYYRLQGLTLTMPPLRERGDRRQLILHLLRREQADCAELGMTPELLAALDRYQWPGNIRQLRNVLRTMVALRDSDVLTIDDLPPEMRECGQQQPAPDQCGQQQESCLNPLRSAEREALLQVLKQARWNISTVARQLGMGRNTLYRKLERLKIDLSDSKKPAERQQS
jgi:transcriptional regulator of acetoin/glycerol metabolism